MPRKSIFSEGVDTSIPVTDPAIEIVPEEVVEETPVPKKTKKSMKVNVDSLNVRTEPDGKVITQIKRDQKVSVAGTEGDWVRISSPIEGYCMVQYLK